MKKNYQKLMNALTNKIKFPSVFVFFKHIIMRYVIACSEEEKVAGVKNCFGQIEIQ